MLRNIILLIAVIVVLVPLEAYPQELWIAKDGSIRNVDTRAMLVDGGRIYLATKNELYMAKRSADKWESIFFIPSGDNEIRCVAGNFRNILIGTRRGLFRSQDFGKTWKNVFKTIIPEKSSILAIDISRHDVGKMVIGTERGVFASDDGGSRWRDLSGALKNKRINCLAFNKVHVYAGTQDGFYMAQYGSSDWQRAYVCQNPADVGESSEEGDDYAAAEEETGQGIGCITIKGPRVYIAAGKKISYSDDICKSWKDLPSEGLKGSINCILAPVYSGALYCSTTKGVFEFSAEKNRWAELYKGADKAMNVKSIVFGSEDEKTLWANTSKGLYRIDVGNIVDDGFVDIEKNMKTVQVIFAGEPTFKDLQKAAMKFNEVNPDKIKQWRSEARLKALAPKVTVGFDSSKSNTYEIYTSATRDYITAGPDDISEGFDVSVSWDLGNVIWSDDQTNIDARSRLTTQLRSDILDDLRRAYFERRRLQFELMTYPPKDMKLRFEKELRIQELTQAIDDITGNYLSENIRANSQ